MQLTIAVGGLVPVGGGLTGALFGVAMMGDAGAVSGLDSHVRYLSGLLLGIGLAFWASIPTIERQTMRVRLLTAIIVIGGLMRLGGFLFHGWPDLPMRLALVMELGVTPAICIWQARVARRVSIQRGFQPR